MQWIPFLLLLKAIYKEFPGGLVNGILLFHFRGPRFDPW